MNLKYDNIQYYLPGSLTVTLVMLKTVMFGAALIKTFAMSVLLGTAVDANRMSISVMMDPFLQNE